MAITFSNTAATMQYAGNRPVFQVEPAQYETMGYMLQDAPDAGVIVPQGTPLMTDMAQKTAKICKYAVVTRKVDNKNFYLSDLGFFKEGDKFFISGAASPSLSTISAVDKDTKKITLSANNSTLKAGDIIVEGKLSSDDEESSSGASETVVAAGIPNRIVARAERMRNGDKSVNAAYRAVAIQNVLHYPAEWLNSEAFPGSILLKGNPHILFVTQ